ncbi:MAG: BlaI/MecI/CopY family transcriptional regulator [Pseudomonadota bacterium]|nr:BlaI/MecI/CopY family transcriptional regulator [Pseudomonadota bacterium]
MSADAVSQPTKPELEILKLLWRRKSLSAREIADELAEPLGWSYSTLRTVLERMVDKELLKRRPSDGVNAYSAAVGKVDLLGRMIQDFSDRVLELDAAPPAVFFAQSKLLTQEEVEELEKVLRAEETKS